MTRARLTTLPFARCGERVLSALLIASVLAPSVLTPATAAAQTAGAELPKEEEAAALSIVAKSKADEGKYETAAELYLQSWQLDGKEVGYLYSAARCFHKASLWEKAAVRYREFLQKAPGNHPGREKAEEYLSECDKLAVAAREQERKRKDEERKAQDRAAEEKRKQIEQAAKAAAAKELAAKEQAAREAAALVAKRQAEAEAWKTPAGWSALGIGAATLAVGAVWIGGGLADRSDLQTDLAKKDDAGRIVGVSRSVALQRQTAANNDIALGSALMGAGVALAGVGGWLLLSRPAASVAVSPGSVSVAFRF